MYDGWVCKCDWEDWFLCYDSQHAPAGIVVKLPEKNGVYNVRTVDEDGYYEEESEFSTIKKNWGQFTNNAISHWKITYDDGWTGYKGVYAWQKKRIDE